jgi:hypothetical protein
MRKTKNLSQECWPLGQDTNVVAPKHEAATLSTQPQPLMSGFCEESIEPMGSIKCKIFLKKLSHYYFFKKDSSLWK